MSLIVEQELGCLGFYNISRKGFSLQIWMISILNQEADSWDHALCLVAKGVE
jgi:hypothetical protein